MDSNEASNDNRLSDFKTIDTSININGIHAKNCQHSHVNIIEESCKFKFDTVKIPKSIIFPKRGLRGKGTRIVVTPFN